MRYPPSKILSIARALLGKTQAQVSDGCELSRGTVNNIEQSEARLESVEKLLEYYDDQGLQFLEPMGDDGWGIRVNFLNDDYRQKKKPKDGSKGPN
jgi:transcriptional regulator with XRE-family HTH domain